MQIKRFWDIVEEHYWVPWAILEFFEKSNREDLLKSAAWLGYNLTSDALAKIKYIRFHPWPKLDLRTMPQAKTATKQLSKKLVERTQVEKSFAILFHVVDADGDEITTKCTQGFWIRNSQTLQDGIDAIARLEKKIRTKHPVRVKVDVVMRYTHIERTVRSRRKTGPEIITDLHEAQKAGHRDQKEERYDMYTYEDSLPGFERNLSRRR